MDEELFEKEKEIERLEFQITECQREIRRLRNVCCNYEENREIRKEWRFSTIKDILKRLGAEQPYREPTGTDTKQFTEDGLKAFQDLKKMLYAIERITGKDMDVLGIHALLEVLAAKDESSEELYQLRILLQKFDNCGWKGRYKVGNWTIANGGYDFWFEIYYKNDVKIQCINGKVKILSDTKYSQEEILNCILQEYDNLCEAER